jgi:iron complex transport system substrate-binding protein
MLRNITRRNIVNKLWKIILALLIALTASSGALGSGSDFTLGIFGNANMDDTIDENDIAYVDGVIKGTNIATNLSDANYDGKIDEKDIDQIKDIMQRTEKELTVVQYIGNGPEFAEEPVTVHMPIKTIIDASYNKVKMLCALDAQDKIVGIVESAKTVTELATFMEDKTVIGQSDHVWDIEKILKIRPDIIHSSSGMKSPEYRDALKAANIPLVMMEFSIPEKYSREVMNMGYLLDKKERAEEIINFEGQHINLIRERLKELKPEQKPRVYLESYNDYKVFGPGSPYYDSIMNCGGISIFDDVASSATIDPEAVIVRNPQVIIKLIYSGKVPSGYNVTDTSQLEKVRSDLLSRPGWDKIDAVTNGRVYLIDLDANSVHPGVYLSYLAKWFHPEMFEDVDPAAIHKEWFERFLGIEYKGVYAYPAK